MYILRATDSMAYEMVHFMNGFLSVTFFLTVVMFTCIMVLVLTDRLEITIHLGDTKTRYMVIPEENVAEEDTQSESSASEASEESESRVSEVSEGYFIPDHDALVNKLTSMTEMKFIANLCDSVLKDPLQKLNLSLEDILTLRKSRAYAETKMLKYLRKTKDTAYASLFDDVYTGEIPTNKPTRKHEFQTILETVVAIAEKAVCAETQERPVVETETKETQIPTIPTFPITPPSPKISDTMKGILGEHAEDEE